jgi:hypothetical protein
MEYMYSDSVYVFPPEAVARYAFWQEDDFRLPDKLTRFMK